MRELLLEIWTSVRRNKLRTFLTGFSVAWGIFMLVILLGSGNGLKNGVLSNFGNYATNSITISGGWTSKAYAGYNKWRSIDLKNRDLEILVNEFPEVDDVAAKAWYRGSTATYLDRFADISLRGSLPKIQQIEGVEIVKGRFINQADIHNYRKVIVIDEALKDTSSAATTRWASRSKSTTTSTAWPASTEATPSRAIRWATSR